jgi:hypothetical protein
VPVFGTGVMPDQGSIANELTAVTRRAYSAHVYVQIYSTSPLVAALLNNAQTMSGGVSPITVPVQGVPMTTIQNIGYDGTFNQPAVTPGLTTASFNPAAYLSVIPFPGMEGLVQLNYAVVPIIEARMNDCVQQYRERFSYDFYQNTTNLQGVIGLAGAVDDGTAMDVYGGISRSANTWWKSQYVNNAQPAAPTRDLINQYLLQQQKANELPKFGICGAGTWGKLASDFTAFERYNITPASNFGSGTVGSKFSAIEIAGVPIYLDPRCPEGTLYLLNPDYLTLYVHERAAFRVLPFESRFPVGQLGYIGGVLTLLQLVCVKPSAQMKVTGLQYLTI